MCIFLFISSVSTERRSMDGQFFPFYAEFCDLHEENGHQSFSWFGWNADRSTVVSRSRLRDRRLTLNLKWQILFFDPARCVLWPLIFPMTNDRPERVTTDANAVMRAIVPSQSRSQRPEAHPQWSPYRSCARISQFHGAKTQLIINVYFSTSTSCLCFSTSTAESVSFRPKICLLFDAGKKFPKISRRWKTPWKAPSNAQRLRIHRRYSMFVILYQLFIC